MDSDEELSPNRKSSGLRIIQIMIGSGGNKSRRMEKQKKIA
jgi:hypothetical protein